jgi:chloramphenicol-sensitive protein RarD
MADTATSHAARRFSDSELGVLLALCAHLVWGGMAYYFGLLRHISPAEIAVNRGLWSLPIAAAIVWYLGQFGEVRKALASPRRLATLALCSGLIVFNWGFYVWSIEVGRTLESSLGYFINPLLNVVMGYLFLGERFTRPQLVALGLAALAVVVQTVAAGVFPWLGLMLASTFCLYGFLRKTIPVGPTQGFFIEVSIIAVPLMAVEAYLVRAGLNHFGGTLKDSLMLMGCGAMTAAALLLFAGSIRRIRYSTAGMLQYISPSLVFLTAVFIFREPIDAWKLASFALIWLALAIFTLAALRDEKNRRAADNQPEDPV